MKKIKIKYTFISLCCCLLFFLHGCEEKQEDAFSIKGQLTSLESPHIFIAIEKNDSIFLDSIAVDKKGLFSYKGQTEELVMASLFFEGKSWATSIFLDKGWNVEIKGDINYPDLIAVSGGYVNDDLTTFKENNAQLLTTKAEILMQIDSASTCEMLQNYTSELKTVNFELTNKARLFIEENPEKIASVVLIQDFYKSNVSKGILDQKLELLKGEAANFALTEDLRKYSEKIKLSQIGVMAPSFNLKKADQEIRLADYKGKYLLIFFSTAHDDTTALKYLPPMMDAYKSFKGNDVEFLSVVMSDKLVESVPDSIKWTVFHDMNGWASEIVKAYNVVEVPYGVLISPKGVILDKGLSVISLIEKINELKKTDKK